MRPVHSAVRWQPVHSTSKQCVASAFNETYPFHWQAACLSIRLAGGTRHATACTILIITRSTKEATVVYQHCTGCGHLGARRSLSVTCISCSMYFFHYVSGPTCRGSVTLYVPPLGYKREGTRRYKAVSLRRSSHLRLSYSILHSGVGYYAPVARTTLNPRVILCVLPQSSNRQNA
jgi:hypothetical protein